jgi:hypothetical protein
MGQVTIITPIYEDVGDPPVRQLVRLEHNQEVVTRNLTSEVDIRDGEWHHLAVVGDSYRIRLYIDGLLDVESLSYYVFMARPAPSFESFYFTYMPIGSVLRAADRVEGSGGIQAVIDETLFWNEDITVEDVRRHLQYGLSRGDIRRGLQVIRPLPEFAVDDGDPHYRLVSYLTFDGEVAPPWVRDAVNPRIDYRMLPLPSGNEILGNTRCPVEVDRLRTFDYLLAGYFAASDGGACVENYMERNDWGYAGQMMGGVSFRDVPATDVTHVTADADGDGLPDWWEVRHGLDTGSAEGAWGAYGDPDGDGLNNVAEYRAGTDPMEADTDRDGRSDFFSWSGSAPGDYRIFGERYTDFDRMPDD